MAARRDAVVDEQDAQVLDFRDVKVFRRVEVVGSGIERARQLLFVERLGDDAAGAGLAHRLEHLRPGFAGHKNEGHRFEIRIGAHGGDQFGAGLIGQVEAADHDDVGAFGLEQSHGGTVLVDSTDLADTLMFQHAGDQMRLHL